MAARGAGVPATIQIAVPALGRRRRRYRPPAPHSRHATAASKRSAAGAISVWSPISAVARWHLCRWLWASRRPPPRSPQGPRSTLPAGHAAGSAARGRASSKSSLGPLGFGPQAEPPRRSPGCRGDGGRAPGAAGAPIRSRTRQNENGMHFSRHVHRRIPQIPFPRRAGRALLCGEAAAEGGPALSRCGNSAGVSGPASPRRRSGEWRRPPPAPFASKKFLITFPWLRPRPARVYGRARVQEAQVAMVLSRRQATASEAGGGRCVPNRAQCSMWKPV